MTRYVTLGVCLLMVFLAAVLLSSQLCLSGGGPSYVIDS